MRTNVLHLFPEPAPERRGPKPCYVYAVGYPHAKHGHVVKVGISSNPKARVGELQVGNPDTIQTYSTLRFERRALAQHVEFWFHETKLGNPLRGEWVGCDPMEALHYLHCIAAAVISSTYRSDPDIRRRIRHESGLQEACDKLDRWPGYDAVQGEYNARWGMWMDGRRKYAR